MVRQYMHNAMSPISAISGYLELLNMSLYSNANVEQLERYRKKIQSGVNEVNSILEQLQEIYSEDTEDAMPENALAVDLNWVIGEVSSYLMSSNAQIIFNGTGTPVYVFADLLVIKMILSNLVNKALKNTTDDEAIEIEVTTSADQATACVRFRAGESVRRKLHWLFREEDILEVGERRDLNSFTKGLVASAKMALQNNGCVDYKQLEDDMVCLSLSLPLAERLN